MLDALGDARLYAFVSDGRDKLFAGDVSVCDVAQSRFDQGVPCGFFVCRRPSVVIDFFADEQRLVAVQCRLVDFFAFKFPSSQNLSRRVQIRVNQMLYAVIATRRLELFAVNSRVLRGEGFVVKGFLYHFFALPHDFLAYFSGRGRKGRCVVRQCPFNAFARFAACPARF